MSDRNLNRRDSKYVYRPCAIAYLDILGFRDLVSRSIKAPELVERIAKILLKGKGLVAVLGGEDSTIVARQFSDTVVLSSPNERQSIAEIVWRIAFYQYDMALEQSFVRGGLAFGDLFESEKEGSEGIVFGPAYLDAYDTEHDRDAAFWPRVVIHRSVQVKQLGFVSLLGKSPLLFPIIRDKTDGFIFVDYLEFVFFYSALAMWLTEIGANIPRPTDGEPYGTIEHHRDAIQREIKRINSERRGKAREVLSKYRRLITYHNDTIRNIMASLPDSVTSVDYARYPILQQLGGQFENQVSKRGLSPDQHLVDKMNLLCRQKSRLSQMFIEPIGFTFWRLPLSRRFCGGRLRR